MPSYRGGYKIDDSGRRIEAVRRLEKTGSDGYTRYTVSIWADGTASCNCPGFTKSKTRGTCKHVREEGFGDNIQPTGRSVDIATTNADVRVARPIQPLTMEQLEASLRRGTPAEKKKPKAPVMQPAKRHINFDEEV